MFPAALYTDLVNEQVVLLPQVELGLADRSPTVSLDQLIQVQTARHGAPLLHGMEPLQVIDSFPSLTAKSEQKEVFINRYDNTVKLSQAKIVGLIITVYKLWPIVANKPNYKMCVNVHIHVCTLIHVGQNPWFLIKK